MCVISSKKVCNPKGHYENIQKEGFSNEKILAILLAGMMTATALVGCGGGDASSKTDNGSKADNGSSDGAAKIEGSIVDDSYFGDEGTDSKPVTLKVWAPDAAVSLVKEQVEAFKRLILTESSRKSQL